MLRVVFAVGLMLSACSSEPASSDRNPESEPRNENPTVAAVEPLVVLVLIDEKTYPDVQRDLDRYLRAVSAAQPVTFIVDHGARYEEASADGIRALLADYHRTRGIDGALLVGRLPYALWEQHWDGANEGVNSFFYEDLDGEWADEDNDNFDDLHGWGENEGPEIFVSWVYPSSANPVFELQRFFDKAYRYHTNMLPYRKRGLVVVHSDWARDMDSFESYYPQVARIFGSGAVDRMGGYTTNGTPLMTDGNVYLDMIRGTYEVAIFYTHADWSIHASDVNAVSLESIAANPGGNVITFVGGCHSGDIYLSPTGQTIASAYIFGTGIGLAATATTWSYGPEELWVVTEGLDEGRTLGEAWLAKQKMRNTPSFYRARYEDAQFPTDRHMFGEILFGDPFVRVQR